MDRQPRLESRYRGPAELRRAAQAGLVAAPSTAQAYSMAGETATALLAVQEE